MSAAVFVDTNVLVYCRDAGEPEKQPQAAAWMEHLWRYRSGRLSFQVLREFYVTVTERLDPGLDPSVARSDVRTLLGWRPTPMSSAALEAAWRIQDRYGLSWWDALIAAAAQLSGSAFLLSEDFQHAQRFGDVEVVNPFRTTPESLPA